MSLKRFKALPKKQNLMSTPSSDFELDLDLQLLPAWARQPAAENRYAKFEGDTGGERFERRGDRPGRPGPRRDGGGRPGGPGGPRREGGGRPGGFGQGGPRREGGRPDRGGAPRQDDRRDARPEPAAPLPEVNVNFTPDEKGVESLARQIKLTGRAYALFDIAALVLKKPERFQATLSVEKNAEGKPIQPLLVCSLDESLWLSEDEVVGHVLRQHFGTFYQAEKEATEPPKGTYTFVAQCGLSGTILGPPNLHDYQDKLRKLHTDRFSRMPFEAFKSRVKIVRDEAIVKKWVEDQSWKTAYVCLNVPEALKLGTRDEVEKHFREVHLANLVRSVDTFSVPAGPQKAPMSPALQALLRRALDDQRRFPLRLATLLSQQFASHGLQFFKVNRTVTHVCVARPRYLDLETTVVSDGVRRIVDFVREVPNCTRRRLVEALAPTPPAPRKPAIPVPAAPPAPAAAPTAAPTEGSAPAPAPAAAAPAEPQAPPPTPEQTAVITDLHWLIHQGHVIEFSDGRMELAKKPLPKPVPAPRPPAAAAAQTGATATEQAPAEDVSGEVTHESPSQDGAHAEEAPQAQVEAPASTAPESAAAASGPEAARVETPAAAVGTPTEAPATTSEPAVPAAPTAEKQG